MDSAKNNADADEYGIEDPYANDFSKKTEAAKPAAA